MVHKVDKRFMVFHLQSFLNVGILLYSVHIIPFFWLLLFETSRNQQQPPLRTKKDLRKGTSELNKHSRSYCYY